MCLINNGKYVWDSNKYQIKLSYQKYQLIITCHYHKINLLLTGIYFSREIYLICNEHFCHEPAIIILLVEPKETNKRQTRPTWYVHSPHHNHSNIYIIHDITFPTTRGRSKFTHLIHVVSSQPSKTSHPHHTIHNMNLYHPTF